MNEEIKTAETKQEEKSVEVLTTLNQQTAQDLDSAKAIEYTIDDRSVAIVNELVAQLESSKTQLDNSKGKFIADCEESNKKNLLMKKFMEEEKSKRLATEPELANLLDNNIKQIDNAIAQNEKLKQTLEDKCLAVENALQIFTFKINEEGKAYLEEDIVKLAHAILNLR